MCSKSVSTMTAGRQTSACFMSVLFRDALLWRQRNFSLPLSIFSWKWVLKGVVDSTFLSIFLRHIAFDFYKIPRNAACQCDSLLYCKGQRQIQPWLTLTSINCLVKLKCARLTQKRVSFHFFYLGISVAFSCFLFNFFFKCKFKNSI